jgi:hypothetical protein
MEGFDHVSANLHNASFDCGPANIDAECQRLAGTGAETIFAHKVCELYPVCAILLSNMVMTEGAPREQPVFLSLPHETSRANSMRHGDFRISHAESKEPKAIRA